MKLSSTFFATILLALVATVPTTGNCFLCLTKLSIPNLFAGEPQQCTNADDLDIPSGAVDGDVPGMAVDSGAMEKRCFNF